MRHEQLSATERRLLAGLRRRRTREKTGLFLAEGVRVAEELVTAGIVPRISVVSSTLADTARGERLQTALAAAGELRVVAEHVLAGLADTEAPQGVLVVAEIPVPDLAALDVPARARVLVLDAVQDPGNFGTIVRSAVAFGASAVLALPGTVDPWNPKAVRAAAGSSFHVAVELVDTDAALHWLRARGFRLCVADASGTPLPQVPTAPRTALIVGNEGAGVGTVLAAAADVRIAIPMHGPVESLNVAVAAGILLHHMAQAGPT